MITLLVGLVSLIDDRADQTELAAVPEAAATSAAEPVPAQADPLAEAGVVPDLPATPEPEPDQEQPILPEQGMVPDLGDDPVDRQLDGPAVP